MFRKPHSFILKTQKNLNVFFSCYRMSKLTLPEDKEKFEVVYISAAYPTSYYNEIIYKTPNDFYLFYKGEGIGGYYSLELYFNPKDDNQAKIFLNSLLKKQK